MSNPGRKKWWIAAGTSLAIASIGFVYAASVFARRFEPYIQQQAIEYLSRRFDSEVELQKLSIHLPPVSSFKLFVTRGRGVIAQVIGENIVLRHKGRRDLPPMFAIDKFTFEVDLGRVFDPVKPVALVTVDGMRIHVPPKGDRPRDTEANVSKTPAVLLERVEINNSELVILPRTKDRTPLSFALHRIVLTSVQLKESLHYDARLTNAKPPGVIDASGDFGPWNAEAPGETPLTGDFTFRNASLDVFPAIGGTLQASGSFAGALGEVSAHGEADVPDFRLKSAGNPVPLHVKFDTIVDGTNGNTVLRPVHAQLNTSTRFTTSGAVLKHDGDSKRSIDLNVNMANGEMVDLMRLAMKGPPLMSGRIDLTSMIRIPPLNGSVSEKLVLDGNFRVKRGQFLQNAVQDKVDELSRRGQGQPKNTDIDNVFSDMAGKFHMDGQKLQFDLLEFEAPGSKVALGGVYDMNSDELDFKGTLRLTARISQTMTGWKRWALKPVDPFFAKDGAGALLRIKVSGSSKKPQFGASR